MDILVILAIVSAIILAINIGANNSASEMSIAYGAGVRSIFEAVLLIAVFVSLGAITAGQPVIKTLGKGIVPEVLFRENLGNLFLILAITGIFIIVANVSKTPVATTHVIVSAIAGIGLYHRQINLAKLKEIASFWVLTPLLFISCGVIGISWSRTGFNPTLKIGRVRRMFFFWIIGPFIVTAITYFSCHILVII